MAEAFWFGMLMNMNLLPRAKPVRLGMVPSDWLSRMRSWFAAEVMRSWSPSLLRSARMALVGVPRRVRAISVKFPLASPARSW